MRERDIRPVVDTPRGGLSNLAIIGIALVLALILFSVLNARRQAASAPAVQDHARDIAVQAPPPLYLPPPPPEQPAQSFAQQAPIAPLPAQPRPLGFQQATAPPPAVAYQAPAPAPQSQAATPARNGGGAALVVDSSQTNADTNNGRNGNDNNPLAAPTSTSRVRAGSLANRSTTVAQGTLIPAVLETAFDSTRPGFARALVQRDIRGFDGTQVLIPRGSRLIGEYAADTAQGQNRAMIAWSRLIRPDGVTIAIGSPVADPVGRGGVKADVNNHFFARFAGAILQSTLDVGVNLASRSSGSPTIVALPGSVQGANLIQTPTNIRPTLRVAQGTSVSVFVARDLDFTDTDGGR
ncbi:TrbI/VirB10 family protein [uncultured Sphingomonas sp.]|uniref:TrbI/VirB10 family protein n=1 Tax=uncultured Sphingomonas sp. TaxID=158754 RepID=UPI0015755BC2